MEGRTEADVMDNKRMKYGMGEREREGGKDRKYMRNHEKWLTVMESNARVIRNGDECRHGDDGWLSKKREIYLNFAKSSFPAQSVISNTIRVPSLSLAVYL